MPIVRVTWFAGRDTECKERVARGIEALMREAGAPAGSTNILFEDVPRENWVVEGNLQALSSPKTPKIGP